MTTSQRRRKMFSIALLAIFLVLLTALATLNAFHLGFLNPETTPEIFAYTALSAMAFVLFVTVVVLLVRSVLKLYAEQRTRLLGFRLRTRMLWGAILVALVPITFMFSFSYLLMNRAVDRWFSQPVTQVREDSDRLALQLSQYTSADARAEAAAIAAEALPPDKPDAVTSRLRTRSAATGSGQQLRELLESHEITLQSGFALVFRGRQAIAQFQLPKVGTTGSAQVKPWLAETRAGEVASGADALGQGGTLEEAILAAAQRPDLPVFSVGGREYALGMAALKEGGTVVVGLPTPVGMSATVDRLRADANTYLILFRSRRQIRNVYTLLLLMITALALFACCWLALHLAKQVTRPVEALADAMDQIAAGDYAHRVETSPTDELAELARSFNSMATDLESSRRAVLESSVQISAANAQLEARRSELETMLETIPNGVATLSPERRIVLANRAFSEMLDPGGQGSFVGSALDAVTPAELWEVLDRLLRRSHRMGTASAEVELVRDGARSNLLGTVALLETGSEHGREHHGYVVVLEDATELLRAQKQSAWKEVARRVAHEIKNPLTPIALSAEQTRRHIDRLAGLLVAHGVESPSVAIIRRCSEATSSSVESMRSLVDQFSSLAEFPTAQPRAADLNEIVDAALALFAGRLDRVRIVRSLAPGLPPVFADPEAMKRALSILVDNAAEAMQHSLLRELHVATSLLPSGWVELLLADTGSGLTDEMRERLFLPYFSTKQRGTGLGLAIAAKIVQEHQGTIRAESNVPAGARFLIELRPATAAPEMDGALDAVPSARVAASRP